MKNIYIAGAALLFSGSLFFSCKNEAQTKKEQQVADETMLAGQMTLYVDNTIQPITEDVTAVFSSIYPKANIKLVARGESDIVNGMQHDSVSVAVLSRMLTDAEQELFTKKNIKPRINQFATDAIAFITNKTAVDTTLNLEEVYKVMQGKPSARVKQLVFEGASSSPLQMLMKSAEVAKIPSNSVYSLNSTREVIDFVQKNPGAIGVIGVNWLVQPAPDMEASIKNISVLAVDNVKISKGEKKYFKPSQSNIADGSYPLTRKLYVLNYQGKLGLGMGFANYITAPDGQRIVLKSGLVPTEIPPREIEVRGEL
ncbi:phosphate ABC transporter substrate-binding protein [Flavobacterium sp. Sd200]|uniref:PstS family phosphate ABC transporter substrate-binding protein n=1 Tax=Flavobacterium sp. Sd200 TaxID=2692211 RepID=UPI00136F6C88|nr:substrate-binding domain-containing protein [Flavobacterium sp. Sd200]MXN92894.1 phosphate ABC transporter substrate-binding protein [Flavobacterium sp. Sd200]